MPRKLLDGMTRITLLRLGKLHLLAPETSAARVVSKGKALVVLRRERNLFSFVLDNIETSSGNSLNFFPFLLTTEWKKRHILMSFLLIFLPRQTFFHKN